MLYLKMKIQKKNLHEYKLGQSTELSNYQFLTYMIIGSSAQKLTATEPDMQDTAGEAGMSS